MNKELCLKVKGLGFSYPDAPEKKILSDVSFQIGKGEIVALVGENGCGKSTLFNLIAGFMEPTSGNIKFGDNKNASMVFQESSLLDWKSSFENIEFGLLADEDNELNRKRRVEEVIKLLNLNEHKEKFPSQLSGGLKQRVAIGRALAPDPNLILFDEPFSALDNEVKKELIREIREILIGQDKSAIFITHNIEEALAFADRILVINPKTRRIGRELIINKIKNRNLNKLKEKIFHF